MPEIMKSPSEFVDYLLTPGLKCSAGNIPLAQYMAKTGSNGGNDNTNELFKDIRFMKDKNSGQTLNTLVGGTPTDLALKGQGPPDAFIKIFDFLCQNKEKLKKKRIDFRDRRDKTGVQKPVNNAKSGNLYDLYFNNATDAQALNRMVADRFFGIDCIGFCGQYLVWAGIRNDYLGRTPELWPRDICKENVKSLDDVQPCDFIVWEGQGHVAVVDYLNGPVDDSTISIDICQSSTGGPRCDWYCTLRDMKVNGTNGRRLFKLQGDIPVQGLVTINRIKDWWW